MAPLSAAYDNGERSREKVASRERDMDDIRSGRASPRDIAGRNDFFANVDVGAFKLVAIGNRPFRNR